MRINAITNVNNRYGLQKNSMSQKNSNPVESSSVSFKGPKGAAQGAALGYLYGGLLTVLSGGLLAVPLLTMGIGTAVVGAIAGNGIENELKDKDDKDDKSDKK